MVHWGRALFGIVLLVGLMLAQAPVPPNIDGVFICPMDPDVRSNNPGVCPRCGMKLKEGIPDPVEYHMDLSVKPRAPQAGAPAELIFSIHDPWKDRSVTKFQVVHEKLFHMFVVSEDMKVFVHDHPYLDEDGDFHYNIKFPKPGMYRLLGDFYPDGATPQLIAKTVLIPGDPPGPPKLTRDYSTKTTENMTVELVTDPPQPIVGTKTMMFFKVSPADGFEKYLGAWGHMLAASDDLIDLIHTHPFLADGGPNVQFNVVFPRAQMYRVWVQFQRAGVVNTAHFDIPVEELK
jgi:hypothetical protein